MSSKKRFEFGYYPKPLSTEEQRIEHRAKSLEGMATKFLKKSTPKRQFRQKTKAQRRTWWNNLTPQQQQAYIERKQAEKSQQRAETHYESPCPDFPEINDSNRADWQARIKKLNPWVQFPAAKTA